MKIKDESTEICHSSAKLFFSNRYAVLKSNLDGHARSLVLRDKLRIRN